MRNELNKLSTTFRSSYGTEDLTPTGGAPGGESPSCTFSERGIGVHTSSAPVAEGSSTAPKDHIRATWRIQGPPRGLASLLPVLMEESCQNSTIMFNALTTPLNFYECRGRHPTLRAYFLKVDSNCIRNFHYSFSLL